jgi:hypothetical protein
MKKSILLCIIFFGMQFQSQAQNEPLNKKQTIDYIEKLYKESYSYNDTSITVVSVTLDNKILQVNLSEGTKTRRELIPNQSLMIKKSITEGHYHIGYYAEGKDDVNVLFHISTESDAKRLLKALEHLIEILKTEKNTDPFGE